MSLIDIVDFAAPAPAAPNIVSANAHTNAANSQPNAVPPSAWDAVFGPGVNVPAIGGSNTLTSHNVSLVQPRKSTDFFDEIGLFAPANTSATSSVPSVVVPSNPSTPAMKPADVFDTILTIPGIQGQLGSASNAAMLSRTEQNRGNMRQLLERQKSQVNVNEDLEVKPADTPKKEEEPKKAKKPTKRRVMTANDLQALRKQAEAEAAAEGKEVDTSGVVGHAPAPTLAPAPLTPKP